MNPFEDEEESPPGEPEEFDPDSLGPDLPDPASDLEVEPPSMEAAADVDEGLFRAFWAAVVFLNVAVAALSLGAMFLVFRGDWSTGGGALVVGAVAALITARYWRQGRRYAGRDGSTDDGTAGEPDDGSDADDVTDPAGGPSGGEDR